MTDDAYVYDYSPLPATARLSVCDHCGAVVADRLAHTEWHEDVEADK